MLRKYVGALFVVSGLILSGNAWAITATVTGQPTGQSEKGGTFTVVRQTSGGKVTQHTGRINPTTHRATVHVPVKKGDTLYGSLDGGLTGKPLTDDQINGTVPIDFSTGVGPIPQPTTYTSVPPPNTYTPSYQIVSNPLPWTGFYIGGQGSFGGFDQRITERITGTDTVTNVLQNNKGMGGVGINAGYDFGSFGVPGATIGPTGSISYLGQSNNRVFSNGAFLGTRDNWTADLGLKGEYWSQDRLMGIYGIAGARFLNYDLQSNFTGSVQMVNRTAIGPLFAVGAEGSRPDWRMGNGQWVAFGQVEFAWVGADTVRMPVFSPGFDYATQINQVTATVGFRYRIGGFGSAR